MNAIKLQISGGGGGGVKDYINENMEQSDL
jgi:hypothetical protein